MLVKVIKRLKNVVLAKRMIKKLSSLISGLGQDEAKWLIWYKNVLEIRIRHMHRLHLAASEKSDIGIAEAYNALPQKNGRLQIGGIEFPPIKDVGNEWVVHFFVTDLMNDMFMPYLLENRMSKKDVARLIRALCTEDPYERGAVQLCEGDIVIDAGSCIGGFSALASAKGCGKAYAFEPVPHVIEDYLSKTAAWNKNIEVCEFALSDSEGELTLAGINGLSGASAFMGMDDTGGDCLTVKTITLDEFVKRDNIERVDFIKADIEGAERHMLNGAKNILREFAPKLAICIYHLPDDLQVIRKIILDANPNYVMEQTSHKLFAYVPK